ncbi:MULTISPECIES: hypothetical protein [Acidithiobacillus]|nr:MULTISPECIES: hypothetical protein [Acidithiobacillus]MEB8486017.1 hypothetical protein [Acidithiobacillus ferriphilus]MEB8490711.1 hypothetical protein [Acidithiobacillus ferriphilus]MEB8493127.1 hypothetical protein [Acidithiobacillus ferriphilus]MEB8513417.1 hypothetical protein [Acidithiobacillus ferriphilus]MEB8522174.1 hypothetical protein [Acidithiobacillus ferriphilus]
MTDQQDVTWAPLQNQEQFCQAVAWVVRHGYDLLVFSADCRDGVLEMRDPKLWGYATEHINALFIHTLLSQIMEEPFGAAILDSAKSWDDILDRPVNPIRHTAQADQEIPTWRDWLTDNAIQAIQDVLCDACSEGQQQAPTDVAIILKEIDQADLRLKLVEEIMDELYEVPQSVDFAAEDFVENIRTTNYRGYLLRFRSI